MTGTSKWTDQRMEGVIGGLLRLGVSLSAFTVLCGGVIYLAQHGFEPADYRTFRGEPHELTSVAGIIHSALSGHGRGLVQLGLLFLIATPVARVAFSIWGFAAERDRLYVIFTVLVLAILLYSLAGPYH